MGAYITLLVVCFLVVVVPLIFMEIDIDSRNRNGKN